MQESQVNAVRSQRPAASRRRGFTLTELLVVIAIIAVLAGLIATAAVRALHSSRKARIVLEIKNLSTAAEKFKTEAGVYPPNGMNPTPVNNPAAGTPAALVQSDMDRMFAKAFTGHEEPQGLIRALCGQNLTGGTYQNIPNGMNAAEAVYFWLGGFSSDKKFPISGPGGPSFPVDGTEPGEVLENRTIGYEFDLGKLGPRTETGEFDETNGRFLLYSVDLNQNGAIDPGENRRINLWHYTAPSSEQPLVYFDTSRHKPYQYDPYASATNAVFPLKKVREGVATAGNMRDIAYVDPKFQILHCGLDGEWGDFGVSASSASNPNQLLLYPEGPFIGPIADTLSNFADGELADESEE